MKRRVLNFCANPVVRSIINDLAFACLDHDYDNYEPYGSQDLARLREEATVVMIWVLRQPSRLDNSPRTLGLKLYAHILSRPRFAFYDKHDCLFVANWLLDNSVRILLTLNPAIMGGKRARVKSSR